MLYIVLDDVGFSAISCYGGPVETPHIDRIASRGVRYTQWHTTALCSPTRSCLLTGRNHTRNRMACITDVILSASFVKDGEDPPSVSTGILSLFHGDHQVGEERIKTQPGSFGLSGTDLTVGRSITRVTNQYPGQRP